MDVHYTLLDDARSASPAQHMLLREVTDSAWAPHRAHTRAGRCFILYGPDPARLFPAPSWTELASGLQGELDYVENHLTTYPAYCVLSLCRLR